MKKEKFMKQHKNWIHTKEQQTWHKVYRSQSKGHFEDREYLTVDPKTYAKETKLTYLSALFAVNGRSSLVLGNAMHEKPALLSSSGPKMPGQAATRRDARMVSKCLWY
ncbi:unnamed protein product [Acanthoscelides obtectus]|uniref:Uncharacterized protein n=1 Tax=Acanthoscelides obtectus TaxID=200917 RepID=A0A9P0LFA1_ACAOB|nr:unnamed protein product [Acanthoscelides obtectus]CAK1679522.1 hypothetical protein AOBTE_LOCUS32321 [Acanthoscelides obtectus]